MRGSRHRAAIRICWAPRYPASNCPSSPSTRSWRDIGVRDPRREVAPSLRGRIRRGYVRNSCRASRRQTKSTPPAAATRSPRNGVRLPGVRRSGDGCPLRQCDGRTTLFGQRSVGVPAVGRYSTRRSRPHTDSRRRRREAPTAPSAPDTATWTVVENSWDPQRTNYFETILTVGNADWVPAGHWRNGTPARCRAPSSPASTTTTTPPSPIWERTRLARHRSVRQRHPPGSGVGTDHRTPPGTGLADRRIDQGHNIPRRRLAGAAAHRAVREYGRPQPVRPADHGHPLERAAGCSSAPASTPTAVSNGSPPTRTAPRSARIGGTSGLCPHLHSTGSEQRGPVGLIGTRTISSGCGDRLQDAYRHRSDRRSDATPPWSRKSQ